jgi:hypothetical protein
MITEEVIDRIIGSGPLTKARRRVRDGSAVPRVDSRLGASSTWSLVCEEIVDTQLDPNWFDAIIAELSWRGFNDDQIDAMRRFAWRTAGWLNYDMMFWDWCHLDESNIRMALTRQLEDGIITQEQCDQGLAFVENPERGPFDFAR